MKKLTTLVTFAASIVAPAIAAPPAPSELELSEGFSNPFGFYNASPSFSWQLPASADSASQTAYQIAVASSPELLPDQADLWNTGKTDSAQSLYIPYAGAELSSRDVAYWSVRYWSQKGEASPWSQIQTFELGLLSNDDWQAKWISFPEHGKGQRTEYDTPLYRPVHFRKDFSAKVEVAKARLYITAKGLFEAHINGQQVGEDRMAPGWTPYHTRVETITYDVTKNLTQGKNTIGLILAEGWYAGRFGPKRTWGNEPPPEIIAQLEIEYADGSSDLVLTDSSWLTTIDGPIRTSGIYDGETYDANQEMPGWNQPGFAASNWTTPIEALIDSKIQLQPKRHFTTRDKIELTPISISKPEPDTIVFDMGQNMVGVPRIAIPMKKGQTLRTRVGEALNRDGTLYTRNLGSAKSINHYTANKDGIAEWQPQFTFHGFRYVEITGYDTENPPEFNWVKGIVQYTDFEDTGHFETSDLNINQLQSNIVWGLRGNFLDIPTDCPQRAERLGWTGDAQVFAPTAFYNSDLHAFWTAWLQSMCEEQYDDGQIPVVIPNATGKFTETGWSDACTIIPWETYWRTGDKKVLEENYDMMLRWLDYSATHVTDGISTQRTVGDWLQPYSQQKDKRRGDTDNSLISTAFYARSIELTQRTAAVLGHTEKSEELKTLHAQVAKAFQERFFDAEGRHTGDFQTQTVYLLALAFNLLDSEIAKKAAEHLISSLEAAEGHLRTGFLGTNLLAPTLDRIGRSDLAFDLLFKETYPSWLFSVSQGATTIWERWDGYTHLHGVNRSQGSLNHYAYGAIGEWMYERIAGIYPLDPGYKKIRISPLVGGPLTFARGKYDSPYGVIASYWEINDEELSLQVTIPSNTTAEVTLPAPYTNCIRLNGQVIETSNHPIRVEPGQYQFTAKKALSK
ncbi:glycoside hydrolase family 78 protein [Pelagicoccus sp. NFK12]|uniref:alpha-L-rhamnosidase n=1 Tax=Pelagicoccus enzymogenes TaxID=2773457 RepID=A0A927F836_9BACT|nr:glycoside hydrolase family 78 protein [Pelagicoccus enzymogenes]MBD5780069.1 glycoside hydrolase family 78 protein [Pelagicoccus enzymogenes]